MSEELRSLGIRGKLKFLAKDSFIYGIASALNKVINLFLFPVLTRYFSVEEFGVIDSFVLLSTLLITVLIFGQDSAVSRFFYEYDNVERRKEVISQSLLIQIVTMAIFLPLLFIFSIPISEAYVNSEKSAQLINIILWQIPFGLLINFAGNILKWTFKRYQFILLNIGSVMAYLLSVLIGVLFFKIGVAEVFYLLLITQAVFGLFGLFLVRRWLVVRSKRANYLDLLKFGVPYGLICVLAAFVPTLDRFIIGKFLSPIELGLYAAAFKISFFMKLPIQAFLTAWGPFYLSIFKDKEATRTYNMVLILYAIVLGVGALFLIILSRPLLGWLSGEDYLDGAVVVYPLALAIIFQNLNSILGIGIDLSKKSYLKIFSYLVSLVVAIFFMWILVLPLGILGVGIGVLIGYICQSIIEAILSYRVYQIRFRFYEVTFIFLALLGITALIFVADQFWQLKSWALLLILAVLCLAVLAVPRVKSGLISFISMHKT